MEEVSQRHLDGGERGVPTKNNSAPNLDSDSRPLQGQEQVLPDTWNQVVASNPPPELPPPPGRHKPVSETYVVQMPKDQIYRVPPPENTVLVERLRKNQPQKSSGEGRCCLWTCLIILAIFILVAVTTVILVLAVFKPKAPSLSVSNLVVKSPKRFEISLTTKNPNQALEMDYEKDGEASLIFKGKYVSGGKTPVLSQSKDGSAVFKVVLKALNSTYPEEMEKSMNDKKSKLPVSLELNINLSLKSKLWKIMTWKSELEADCKFKVSSLKEGAKILSENCKSKMDF